MLSGFAGAIEINAAMLSYLLSVKHADPSSFATLRLIGRQHLYQTNPAIPPVGDTQ